MEQRITLVSDPTDEFPQNHNNSFKVRIPDRLRLEGSGWHVALRSLTLPNSDSESHPFVTGHDKTVVKAFWRLLHFQGVPHQPKDILATHGFTTLIKEPHVAEAIGGVAFWSSVIQTIEQDVMSKTHTFKRQNRRGNDIHPTVYVKESMCPSFRWEGEDLVLQRRGSDTTDGRNVNTLLYSYFDVAYEVALQWGFIQVDQAGKVTIGPNLRVSLFLDDITTQDPSRTLSLRVPGLTTLNGKAFHPQQNRDMPRGNHKTASGSTVYDPLWYYTTGNEKWIRLSGYFEWHFTNLNATYDAIHKHTGKAVMIYTDLQQSTMVGSTKAQLLRQLVVRQGGDAGHSYAEPLRLEWIPVSTQETDRVEVQLADVDGHLLTLPHGKSLVTVALKQMV